MIKKYYSVFGPALRMIDALILGGSWVLAYYLRRDYPLNIMHNTPPPFEEYWPYLIVIILLWETIFSVMGLYASQRMSRRTIEAYKVFRAHVLSLLIFIAFTYVISTYKLSRGVFVYFGSISVFCLISYRLLLRNTLRYLRTKGYNLQRVLIVGTELSARHSYRKLTRHPELGLHVVGFVGNTETTELEGLPIVGRIEEISQLVHQHQIQKLIIALSSAEAPLLQIVLEHLKDALVDITLIPAIYEYVALGCEVEDFDGLPLVNLNDYPLSGWGAYAKRLVDVVLSIFALIFFSPLLFLIGLVVKFSSKGPIFYKQERMGLDGRKFEMLKFRSMRMDAEKITGAVWAIKDDHRRTAMGAFLRKTSLDELPQFWNVLRGEMSLVGPRPERPVFVDQFRGHVPHYMLRHKVKAGITGWAQVNGWRGDTSLEKRIEYDLYYIRNWSILFDLKIIFLTAFKGFINRNAY